MSRCPLLPALVVMGLSATAGPATAAERVVTLCVVQDAGITESSGLLDRGATVLTVNDSGSAPVVFVVDSATGATLGRTTYTADEVVDVEALAAGPDGEVWVGDIGDNAGARDLVTAYRVPSVGAGDATVQARRYDLSYPDGPRDAETLLVQPRTGRLFVVAKGLFSGQVYRAPRRLSTTAVNRLELVGRVGGLVTDGAFLADGRVVLRDYGDAMVVDPGDHWRQEGSFRLPAQEQGEGLAVRPSGARVLVSSEGVAQPVLSVRIPPRLLVVARDRTPAGTPAAAQPRSTSGERGPEIPGWPQVAGLAALAFAAALAVRVAVRAVTLRGARRRSRSLP